MNATIDITVEARRAEATINMPGLPGLMVSRTGRDDREALGATFRALADLLDSKRRSEMRSNIGATVIRLSLDVDVKVPTSEYERANHLEEAVISGNPSAAEELLAITTNWMATAIHDNDAREFQSFDWCLADEAEEVHEA